MRLNLIPPLMPVLVDDPPEGAEWSHEAKFDGYRSQIVIDEAGIRIFTRNGHDWSARYRPLLSAAAGLGLDHAIIDGEIVTINERGLSDFGALREAIERRPQDLYFVAFDLLHLGDHNLRKMHIEERRQILAGLIPTGGRIQFSEELEGDARELFRQVEAAGLEGIVSKHRDSRYRSGPSRDWLKVKAMTVDEFDVIGVEREPGKPAFALMAERSGERRYVGSAFVTLPGEIRERLWRRVQEKSGPPPKGMKKRPATQWVKPGLVARVRHLRGEEKLRHATVEDFWEE